MGALLDKIRTATPSRVDEGDRSRFAELVAAILADPHRSGVCRLHSGAEFILAGDLAKLREGEARPVWRASELLTLARARRRLSPADIARINEVKEVFEGARIESA